MWCILIVLVIPLVASTDNTKSFDLTTVSINTDLTSLTTLSVTLIPLPALICCTLLLISGVNLSSKTLLACANDPSTLSPPLIISIWSCKWPISVDENTSDESRIIEITVKKDGE